MTKILSGFRLLTVSAVFATALTAQQSPIFLNPQGGSGSGGSGGSGGGGGCMACKASTEGILMTMQCTSAGHGQWGSQSCWTTTEGVKYYCFPEGSACCVD